MADRYWVGGSDNWNTTAGTKWAATSGGTGGETVPTASDNVYFDANSGAVTVTCTAANACANLSFTSGAGDFTGTFAGATALNISGGLVLSSGMTRTYTGTMTFNGTGSFTINTNGKALDNALTFNNAAGTWTFAGAVTTGASRTVNLTAGTLDLAGYTLTCGIVSTSNSNVRTFAFGATGEAVLLGNGAAIWTSSTATNFTITGNKVVRSTYSGSTGTRTINFGNALPAEYTCSVYVSAGTDTLSLQTRYYNLDLTGFAGTIAAVGRTVFGGFVIGSGCTFTGGVTTTFAATSGNHTITTNGVTTNEGWLFNGSGGTWSCSDNVNLGSGTLTFRAGTLKLKAGGTTTVNVFTTSGSTEQHYLQSTVSGTQATLSQASGTVTASLLTIKDINATGGATWLAYVDFNNVDAGGNTGWDFSNSPAIDNEFPIALRSFTQPKRF